MQPHTSANGRSTPSICQHLRQSSSRQSGHPASPLISFVAASLLLALTSPSFPPSSHLALQSSHEFSPTSAILGGMLAQDLLKAMAKKDPPLLNFCAFDGIKGAAWTARFGVGKAEEVAPVL